MDYQQIIDKEIFSKKDIISLLQINDDADLDCLFAKARKVRDKYFGNKIFLRGIIEFSNFCEQDCLYCGLRKSNGVLQRYRMSQELIFKTAEAIFKKE